MSNTRRFCVSCGAGLMPGARFCTRCGRPLARPAAPVSLAPAKEHTLSTPEPAPLVNAPRRGFPWLGLTMVCGTVVLLAAVLGVAIAAGFRPPEALQRLLARPQQAEPYVWDVEPNPHAGYSSLALDAEPLPGVRITAPAGALDQPREFKVRTLSEREAKPVVDRLAKQDTLVVAALEVDAAMEPFERLRLPVTLTFDLQQLGVDAALWPYAQVVTLDEEDRLSAMASQVEDARLSWNTTHNGPIFIAVGLSTIVGLIERGLIEPDRQAETEGKKWYGILSSNGHFNVLWPADRHQPTPQAGAAFAELQRLWKEFAFARRVPAPAPGVPVEYRSLEEYKAALMEQIKALEAQVNDREWQSQQWAHPAAPFVAESLEFAYSYLKARGFNPPGHVVNVYLRSPWPLSKDIKGLAENRKTRDPYISVDLDSIPVKARGGTLTGKDGIDVDVTLAHELFHVFQSQYGSSEYWDRNVFWVGEATALALEHEIWDHYQGRLGDRDLYEQALTLRDQYWYAYRIPMEPLSLISGNTELQHHGYGQSFFFEYLKQSAFAGQEDTFLPAFYNAFNQQGSAAGALQVLARAWGQKDLAAFYAEFVSAHADDIAAHAADPQRENISILPRARSREWTTADAPPLSSQIYRLAIREGVRGYDKAVAVIETRALPAEIKLRTRGLTKSPWVEVTPPTAIVTPTLIRTKGTMDNGFLLQTIGAYAPMDTLDSGGGWSVTFLLPPPVPKLPQGPRIDFERAAKLEELDIRWERSPLAGRDDFRYLITVKTLQEGQPVGEKTLLVEPTKTRAAIPFAELLPALAEAEDVRYEIRVTVSEVLMVSGRQAEGAPSEEAAIAIDASPELKTYKGKSSLSGATIQEEFTYYDAYKGMPASWVPGFTVPAQKAWNGNAVAWRWLVEFNEGAHPRKVLHGKYVMRYGNGQLCAEAEYRYGVLHGAVRVYHEDGALAGTGQYVNGELDGEWIAYWHDGSITHHEIYDKGVCVERKK